jgi:hypothetical protein
MKGMRNLLLKATISTLVIPIVSTAFLSAVAALAQDQPVQEKLQAIQKAQAENKQELAHYTWQETETISIQGQDKDTKVYQVLIGPDGQQKKTEIVEDMDVSPGKHQGHVKKHLQEYIEYAQQISALAKQYTTPNPDALLEASKQGNVSLQPGVGIIRLLIKNYLKPGDSITMLLGEQSHSPVSVQIKSYLTKQTDSVNITAEFGQLPAGPTYVVNATIEGVSKQSDDKRPKREL